MIYECILKTFTKKWMCSRCVLGQSIIIGFNMLWCIVIVLRIGIEPITMEVRVLAGSRLHWSEKENGDNEQAAPVSIRNEVLLRRF